MVALVGDKGAIAIHPQAGATPQHIDRDQHFLDQRFGGLPAKGNHLDRQRKGPQRAHFFAGIGNHDHLIAGGGHDFFLQQRPAAAFDQVEIGIKLIGAIDRQIQPFRLVQRNHLDAQFARQGGCAGRGGHGAYFQAVLAHNLGQAPHHPCRGRASAKAHAHAIFYEINRAFGGDEFCLVDGRQFSGHGRLLLIWRAYRPA